MSKDTPPTPAEAQAAKRYTVMNLVRLASVFAVILGIAIAQGALALPYALGVVIALGGALAFFFGPTLLVRRWKAGDRSQLDDGSEQ
jgi:uncharacterized membrane protein YhaH (DUF805 family)